MGKPIRVALSGSGFRFPAHVGALMAIAAKGYTPIEYAGTSGGSIIAALAASGMDLDEMKYLTLNHDWNDMLTLSLGSLLTGKGYCDGSNMLKWMMQETKGMTFAQLPVDLTVMSSDSTFARPFKWSKSTTPNQTVALATRASASIPFVYTPVYHNGIYSVDGGVENNLPVMKLVIDSVPRIGIDLVSRETKLESTSPLAMASRILSMMLGAAESTQAMFGQYSGAHIAYIETEYASSLDRNMSTDIRKRLLQDGYEEMLNTLEQLKD